MSLIDYFLKRRSIRAFSNQKVTKEQINKLFDACKWAPSAYNEQPWLYYFALKENEIAFAHFIDCLVEANQKWAKKAQVMMLSIGIKIK
jgi:nitroreductase